MRNREKEERSILVEKWANIRHHLLFYLINLIFSPAFSHCINLLR